MDWLAILKLVLEVIGGLAICATATPNSHKNTVVDYVLQGINVGAMNLGKARNR